MKHTMTFTAFVIFCLAPALAQNRQFPGPPAQRVEQFKKLRMIEALKLDEDTSVRFFAKYTKHEEVIRDINKQRNDLLDHLQDLKESNASDAEMTKVFGNLQDLDVKQSEERVAYLKDIKTVVSTKQLADLFLFERNFARNVRQLMQEMARERRQGGR